jgi:hypothetical protein
MRTSSRFDLHLDNDAILAVGENGQDVRAFETVAGERGSPAAASELGGDMVFTD